MRQDRLLQRSLFGFFLALYLLAAGDHYTEQFYASDEMLLALTTVSMVEDHSLHFKEAYGVTTAKFGVLQSAVAVPFYLLAKAVVPLLPAGKANLATIHCLYLTNAFICALIIALFFGLARYLRYPRPTALAASLALGLTTIIFPYAKMFFSEPLVALLLLASVGQMARFARRGRPGALAWTGVWFALAILARADNMTLLPVYLLAVAAVHLRQARREGGTQDGAFPWLRLAKGWLILALPLLGAGAVMLAVNALRYGSPWRSGYGEEPFSTPLLAGVYGLLVSPGRGLLIYSPALLIVPFVMARFTRKRPLLAALIIEIFLLKLYFFGTWWSWQGGWSWGSRFLLPVVPLLFLPLCEALLRWRRWGWPVRAAIAGLFVAGVAVQLLGVLGNPNKHGNDIWGMIGRDENQFLFIPQLSFLAGNLELIREGRIDSFLLHFREQFGAGALAVVLGAIGLLLTLSAIGLVRRGGLRLGRVFTTTRVPLDNWFARVVATLVVLNVLVFATAHITLASNKIPRQRLLPTPAGLREVGLKLDRTIKIEENWPEGIEGSQDGPLPLYRWQGWIMMPLTGDYTFNMKVSGFYQVRIGEQVLFSNNQERQQHLPSRAANFKRGLYPIEVQYQPVAPDYRLLHFYWTVPGFGIYRALVSNAHVFAEPPSPLMRALLSLNQFKWLVVLLSVMTAAALAMSRKSEGIG